ncbi:transmembrane protein 267 isoform X1 [Lycorma delicatula]|uniref:transmembrane protein 267 isoform X1 n=1 Tax=Lycorma delicatula TaxID=130591 RepID=UPI003F513357
MFYVISLAKCIGVFDLTLIIGTILTAIIGDYLLKKFVRDLIRGIIDSTTHGIIGLLSWFIVTLHIRNRYSKYEIFCCGIFASLIDIDHFIKAKSFRLKHAMHLAEVRPFLHCSSIPVLLLIFSTLINYIFKSNKILRYGWLLWTAFMSHHIRDANRRGLWFYPFGSTPPLSSFSYICLILFLPYTNVYCLRFLLSSFGYEAKNYISPSPASDVCGIDIV